MSTSTTLAPDTLRDSKMRNGTSGFAILSKRIVRTDREHIFNPAALALVWAPIAFGSA